MPAMTNCGKLERSGRQSGETAGARIGYAGARKGRQQKRIGDCMRRYVWTGVIIGSTVGGMVPMLWGDDMFSYASVWLSAVGGAVGLWAGYRFYG